MISIFFAPAGANSARLFRQSERRTRGAFCTFSGRLPDLSLRGSAGAVAISGRHCRPTPAIVGARHASPGTAQTIRTGHRENGAHQLRLHVFIGSPCGSAALCRAWLSPPLPLQYYPSSPAFAFSVRMRRTLSSMRASVSVPSAAASRRACRAASRSSGIRMRSQPASMASRAASPGV